MGVEGGIKEQAHAKVVGWLSASESDFEDTRGNPAPLYRIKYLDGALAGDEEDLEDAYDAIPEKEMVGATTSSVPKLNLDRRVDKDAEIAAKLTMAGPGGKMKLAGETRIVSVQGTETRGTFVAYTLPALELRSRPGRPAAARLPLAGRPGCMHPSPSTGSAAQAPWRPYRGPPAPASLRA
mgnify:CR=1 FL=1